MVNKLPNIKNKSSMTEKEKRIRLLQRFRRTKESDRREL